MVFVEYTCDLVNGRLFRNVMPYDAPVKPALPLSRFFGQSPSNPPVRMAGSPCFLYDQRTFGGTTFVIGVAVMTTVRTQERDRYTNDFQRVTKALLNVSPRNVMNVWQLASLNYQNRYNRFRRQCSPCSREGRKPFPYHLLRSDWSDERGVALVMALLMVLAVSILHLALTFVANAERSRASVIRG